MLNTVHHPATTPSDLPPLLIAHGLYGSARNWNVIAKRLSDTRNVLTVDMRNHGESPWMPSHTYPELAADLTAAATPIPVLPPPPAPTPIASFG